jgi:hypothetical protein
MAQTNMVVKSDKNPVGMIISSMLTLAQFQAINGTAWVLADGSNIAGSLYATTTGTTTIPDLRGTVLRGKNNGRADGNQNPGGDNTLGTFENDAMQGHYHGGGNNYLSVSAGSSTGTFDASGGVNPLKQGVAPIFAPATDGTNGTPRTGLESRMKNVTVNHFIKINN